MPIETVQREATDLLRKLCCLHIQYSLNETFGFKRQRIEAQNVMRMPAYADRDFFMALVDV
jgi:hypothetical protein